VSLATIGLSAFFEYLSLRFEHPNLLYDDPKRLWTEVCAVQFELLLVALSLLLVAALIVDRGFGRLWASWLVLLFVMLFVETLSPNTEHWAIIVPFDVATVCLVFVTAKQTQEVQSPRPKR
jgi:thiol:disulfide interchange protein